MPMLKTMLLALLLVAPTRQFAQKSGMIDENEGERPDASDRMEVLTPSDRLVFLKKNKIRLKIRVSGITSLRGNQTDDPRGGSGGKDVEGSEERRMPIRTDKDGTPYVEVIPRHMGLTTFVFAGEYPDGGTILQRVVAEVGAPLQKLLALTVGQVGLPDFDLMETDAYLHGREPNYLIVMAKFAGTESIQLRPSLVRFDVRSPPGTNVLSINAQGKVIPLQVGHALVEVSYGGLRHFTCISVKEEYKPGDLSGSYCEDLLEPGESLPKSAPH